MKPSSLRLGLFGLAYFSANALAYWTRDSGGFAVPFWFANGIALAALLLNPRASWPALLGLFFIGGLAADLAQHMPLPTSVGFMAANVLESFGCAWLISRWGGERVTFARKEELLALMAAAALVNGCTAFVSTGAAMLVRGAPFWRFYCAWWITNGLSLLFVTPFIVVWATHWKGFSAWRWNRALEATLLMLGSVFAAWLIFNPAAIPSPLGGQTYLLFLLIIWAALRFGLPGMVTVLAVLAAVMIRCACAGSFPLGGLTPAARFHTIQAFLAVVSITGMILASATEIAERRRKQREVAENDLRELTRQLIDSQETERRRIAIGLHESLAQDLLLIKARAELAASGPPGAPREGNDLSGISELASRAIREVRQLSHDLRPYQIDELGLTRALEAMIDRVARSTAIVFARRLEPIDDCLSSTAAIHVYRMVQEGLNNILKHSSATEARIEINRGPHHWVMTISDNGSGFTPGAPAPGFGLKNIAERVRILKGRMQLETQPGRGVRLEITLPIAAKKFRTGHTLGNRARCAS